MTTTPVTTDDLSTWLAQEIRPTVDAHIVRSLQDQRYHDRLRYQVETGGKRLRPGLVLLVNDLCGLEEPTKLDSAAAVELLHTFSLIHDNRLMAIGSAGTSLRSGPNTGRTMR